MTTPPLAHDDLLPGVDGRRLQPWAARPARSLRSRRRRHVLRVATAVSVLLFGAAGAVLAVDVAAGVLPRTIGTAVMAWGGNEPDVGHDAGPAGGSDTGGTDGTGGPDPVPPQPPSVDGGPADVREEPATGDEDLDLGGDGVADTGAADRDGEEADPDIGNQDPGSDGGEPGAGDGDGDAGEAAEEHDTGDDVGGDGDAGDEDAIEIPDTADVQSRLADLGYLLGPADGREGQQTTAAVMAFQRVHGLTVDGIVGPVTAEALAGEPTQPTLLGGPSDRIEVDLDRQLLHLVEDDARVVTLHVSSGNGEIYGTASGGSAYANTPVGTFSIERRIHGVREADLGTLYDPLYFYGGFAIHGSPSVPAYPASHGCIRITRADAQWLIERVPDGMPVLVHGGTHTFAPQG